MMFSKLIQKPLLRNIFVSTFLASTILVTPACLARSSIHEDRSIHLSEQGKSDSIVDVDAWIERAKKNIVKKTLSNGLTVLFYRKENTPEVSIKVAYDIGSKNEKSEEYGFAHLVEHMIFKGTKKLSEQDIWEIARKYGAEANAFTSYDNTVYYFDTDKKNWKVFATILADCMKNARFADEHLKSELKTVFDEIKMRDADATGNLFTELFPSNHPYHHPVVGYKENLLHLNPKNVRAFYKKYYTPNHATVIVVGDLDADDVMQTITKKFDSTSFSFARFFGFEQKIKNDFTYLKKDFSQKNIVVYKSVPYTSINYLWTIPDARDAKSTWITSLIGKYLSYRLDEILHDKKGITLSTSAYAMQLQHAGVFEVCIVPQKEAEDVVASNTEAVIDTCKDILIEEIEQIITEGIPQDEFARLYRMEKVYTLKTFEHVSAIAYRLMDSYLINKNEFEMFDRLQLFDSVSNYDVKAFAQKYLRPFLMNSLRTEPIKGSEKDEWLTMQSAVDKYDDSLLALKITRSAGLEKPIVAKKLSKPTLLDVKFEKPDSEFDLKNGLHVVVKQRSDMPFIFSRLSMKDYSMLDRSFAEQGKGLVSDMVNLLLEEESVGYTKKENREFFENLGASVYTSASSCVSSDFETVLQRWIHIITKPVYPEKACNQLIKDHIERLEKSPEDENFVASDTLSKHLRRDDQMSQKTVRDRIADIKTIKRSDIVEFHRQYIVPQNFILVVVGDFDVTQIQQQLERTFGQWKASSVARNVEDVHIDFPQLKNPEAKEQKKFLPKERVVIEGGRITLKKDEADSFSLMLLNQYFNKVLFELREQFGLFYSIGGDCVGYGTRYQQGQASVFVELSLEHVDKVLALIKSTLKKIAEHGIPEDDFEHARTEIITDYAKANVTSVNIACSLARTKADGRSWDYEEKRFEKIMKVSRKDVNKVARKYLNPSKWSFVIVGRVGEEVEPS